MSKPFEYDIPVRAPAKDLQAALLLDRQNHNLKSVPLVLTGDNPLIDRLVYSCKWSKRNSGAIINT